MTSPILLKELTPEFYTMPEFLLNTNQEDFGERASAQIRPNNVELPPWAKGSAHVFIERHRAALESPYVSSHLHEWIDLIFGFKQQGKAAEDATNVFFPMTYDGAVDIDAITDRILRDATIAQLQNFGQTPRQLFDTQHPPRHRAFHDGLSISRQPARI